MPDSVSSFRDLSFVSVDGKWERPLFGDYDTGTRLGRDCAREMVDLMQDSNNPIIFGAVSRLLPTGDWTAFETGFCAQLGIVIISSPATPLVDTVRAMDANA